MYSDPCAARTAPPSLAARAYEALLNRIELRRIRPGQLLNRRAVAAELDVSVAPVIEAMIRLETEGLLETLPRKGTRVRLIDSEGLRGQLIVREAIECEAARLACGGPVRRHAPRLLPLARRIDATRLDAPGLWALEVGFHRSLVALAETPALLEAFDRVMRLGLFFAVNELVSDATAAVRSSHESLLRRLQRASPDAADRAVRSHLRTGKDPILRKPGARFGPV